MCTICTYSNDVISPSKEPRHGLSSGPSFAHCALETTVDDVRRGGTWAWMHVQVAGPLYHVVSRVRRAAWSASRSVTTGRKPSGGCVRSRSRSTRNVSRPSRTSVRRVVRPWLAASVVEETTRRTYRSSLEYAKQVIGSKPLRKVTTSDVRAFLDHIERVNRAQTPARGLPDDPGQAPASSRRLPPGGEDRGADRREPRPSPCSERDRRPQKKRPSYFTNEEFGRLWPELARATARSRTSAALLLRPGCGSANSTALRWDD